MPSGRQQNRNGPRKRHRWTPTNRYRSQRIVPDIGPEKKRTRTIRTMDIWSMTSNPWNKAKGSIDPNEPNRYRHADHVPIYRSKTKYGTGWSIDTTWTSRLRYRKLPSIESDIGDGPYRIIWTRYRSKRRNAAADGQAGSEPNGPNRSSGGMDGLPCDRPISEMILGRPSDRYRAGHAGGGESIRETICT